jgi:hypothetical protein
MREDTDRGVCERNGRVTYDRIALGSRSISIAESVVAISSSAGAVVLAGLCGALTRYEIRSVKARKEKLLQALDFS